jgi:hypothetical protein
MADGICSDIESPRYGWATIRLTKALAKRAAHLGYQLVPESMPT